MLVDSTFFTGKLYLPNMTEPDVNNRLGDDLQTVIDTVEEKLLSAIFGREMWLDFKAKYENKETVPLSAEYQRILDGHTYEINGKKYFWLGLINDETKQSLIADLVYYEYKANTSSITTELGEASINLKAGDNASNTYKMVEAFNSFADKCFGGFRGIADGYTINGDPFWYIGGRGIDFYGINRNNETASLVQFLYDNVSDYPLLKFNFMDIDMQPKNTFGI